MTAGTPISSILWRRLDTPGHEIARLARSDHGWRLTGHALFSDDTQPCSLHYVVALDHSWTTLSAAVSGSVGEDEIDVQIEVDASRVWRLNGGASPQVEGCLDVDLNFSPSTNLLPIRRLNLAVGQEASVRAAWLRFPTFRLEKLEQTYHRSADRSYRYRSTSGFAADLEVDSNGMITRYGDIWIAEAPA